jgi:hypothetical protein
MSINLPSGVITLAAYAIAIPAAISARLTSAPRKKSNSFGDKIIPPAKDSLRLHFAPDLTDPGEHLEPTPEAVAPADDYQEPAPEALAPADDYQEPAPEALAPADDYQEPAPEALAPADDYQEPAPEALAPADDYQEPAPEAVAGIHGKNATKADRAAAALKKAVKKAKAQKVSKAAKEVGPN